MSDLTCYFEYVYEPITELSKMVFQELVKNISSGSVLDLGCGQIGHYWAMGYIDKVSQVSFLDYHSQNIDRQADIIFNSNPIDFEKGFSSTLDYLKTEKFVNTTFDIETLFSELIQKTSQVCIYDFLKASKATEYDHILAIESIECVNTKREFIKVLNNIYTMLNPNGVLHASILRYDQKNQDTENLINQKMEGGFNPDIQTIINSFENTQLELISCKSHQIQGIKNYPQVTFIQAMKK